jgi:hypothetical protein
MLFEDSHSGIKLRWAAQPTALAHWLHLKINLARQAGVIEPP